MGGDFNTILSAKDKRGGSAHLLHPQCYHYLNTVFKELNWIDIWREMNPEIFRFTWRRANLMERIDFIIVSQDLYQYVINVDILPAYKTDHSFPYMVRKNKKSSRLLEIKLFSSPECRLL